MYVLLLFSLMPLWGDSTVVETISTGERFAVEEHLDPNYFVIFEFYASWCGPCRKWAPMIERLAEQYPDHVVVKKVDIKNWGTPVAIQNSIERLPYLWLYNPKGRKVRSGHPREVVDYLKKKAKKEKW